MASQLLSISNGALSAQINPLGAELWSLADAAGRALMTDADPAYWTGHAPLLFPIVGTLRDDSYRLDGVSYSLPRHGFARRMPFALVEQADDRLALRLSDTAETRAVYPFAFTLDVAFALEGAALTMTVTATNRDARDMPASFGFHPAFAWPLPYDAPRGEHRIRFERDEPAPLKELVDGLIAIEDRPSPVEGRTLKLEDALFERDALIWEGIGSEKLVYGPDDGPSLAVSWGNMPNLGLWTKPGAAYLCIEPWAGIADRADFTGEIWDKPGMTRIAPGAAAQWWMRVALQGA